MSLRHFPTLPFPFHEPAREKIASVCRALSPVRRDRSVNLNREADTGLPCLESGTGFKKPFGGVDNYGQVGISFLSSPIRYLSAFNSYTHVVV